jgi:hypothetical protein
VLALMLELWQPAVGVEHACASPFTLARLMKELPTVGMPADPTRASVCRGEGVAGRGQQPNSWI